MNSENQFLLHAFFLGIRMTLLYDLLRILRRHFAHSLFVISVEDFTFWCFCGGEVFLLMYRESNGTLRWFAVLGALTGMLLYKKTLGEPFVKYVSLALKKLLQMLKRLFLIVSAPVRYCVGKIQCKAVENSVKIKRNCGKMRNFVKNRLTVLARMLKIILKKV